MKKLFIFMGALALVAGAFGIKGNRALKANADEPISSEQVADLKAMMNKYIDANGRYTKKSHIYLKTSTPDFATYFHAGATDQERTTYYTDNALLMGDLDGGFTNINSGYANSGANMVHFRSQDGISGLVVESSRTPDYTVVGKQMSDYFFNLHDLVNSISAADWGYYNGNYYHNITTLGVNENGDFNDTLLKKFQYFAAPMLLQTDMHYLSYKSIVINETSGYLHIAIYLSDGDSGKVDRPNSLLAEACVYSGLVTPGYYLVGTMNNDKYDWQISSGYSFGAGTGTNLADFSGIVRAGEYKVCQLKSDGWTTWFGLYGSEDNNNMRIVTGGTFNIYLSGNENTLGYIYKERTSHETANVTFNIEYWTDTDDVYITGPFSANGGWKADADYKLSTNDNKHFSGTFAFPVDQTLVFKFITVPKAGGDINWETRNNREEFIEGTTTLNCSWNN